MTGYRPRNSNNWMAGSANFSLTKIEVLETKINYKCSYVNKEPSSDSEAGGWKWKSVRSLRQSHCRELTNLVIVWPTWQVETNSLWKSRYSKRFYNYFLSMKDRLESDRFYLRYYPSRKKFGLPAIWHFKLPAFTTNGRPQHRVINLLLKLEDCNKRSPVVQFKKKKKN